MLNMDLYIQIPLGLITKNENLNEDMLDIMNDLQTKYCPDNDSFLFFGGDELTEERARNIQRARNDEIDMKELFGHLWPKNEDWHLIWTGYKVNN